ncbi:MAG: hypothetical protein KAH84_11450 [Thiomargarita sp.]|nr:hypothetical protein [Thiomargarita sp.]
MNNLKNIFTLFCLVLSLIYIPQVLATEANNTIILFDFSSISDFDYIKWFNYYTHHFWFFIHIILFIYVLITFVFSFSQGMWKKVLGVRAGKPLITEIYIGNITRRYHLFAEIFLLVGLAGAALSVQSAITPDFFKVSTNFEQNTSSNNSNTDIEAEKHEKMAEAIKSGLAFSAAGIIFAIFCYMLRNIELRPYRSILLREKQREKIEFRNSLNNISKLYNLFEQFVCKDSKNPDIITLSNVLDVLNKHSTENLRKMMSVIQKSQSIFNQQLEEIKHFQNDLIQSKHSIQYFLNNIKSANDDLKASQFAFKKDLFERVEHFLQAQSNYLEKNASSTQLILENNLERISQILLVNSKQEIEKIHHYLNTSLTKEHTLYLEKLEKYQSFINDLDVKANQQVQQALTTLKEENDIIHQQMFESVEKLKAIIVSDFLEEIGEHTRQLADIFNTYLDNTSQVADINKLNIEIVKDTMEKAGLSPKKSILKKIFKNS